MKEIKISEGVALAKSEEIDQTRLAHVRELVESVGR